MGEKENANCIADHTVVLGGVAMRLAQSLQGYLTQNRGPLLVRRTLPLPNKILKRFPVTLYFGGLKKIFRPEPPNGVSGDQPNLPVEGDQPLTFDNNVTGAIASIVA